MAVRTVSGYPHIQFFTQDDTVKTLSYTYENPVSTKRWWPVMFQMGYLQRMNYDNIDMIFEDCNTDRLVIVFKELEHGEYEYVQFSKVKKPASFWTWFSPYSWFW